MRAFFGKLMRYAEKLIGIQAAIGYWKAAAIRACLLTLHRHAGTRTRQLRLIRGALSHHASVLLQAVVKEWFIAVRHDCLARDAWRRASLAVGFSKWCVRARAGCRSALVLPASLSRTAVIVRCAGATSSGS